MVGLGVRKVKGALGEEYDVDDDHYDRIEALRAKKVSPGGKKVKGAFGEEYDGMAKPKRAPSAYALFVKEFARKHPGPDLMKRAAAAYKSR